MATPIQMTGRRFGRWLVLGAAQRLPTYNELHWRCLCDCGNERIVTGCTLRNGASRSCGCAVPDATARSKTRHGHSAGHRKGLPMSPEYRVWCAMRRRCLNASDAAFADYGGRGIGICERWGTFEKFLADMGERPPNTTLDRIDNDRGYAPENCRWATAQEQANNRRANRHLTHEGLTMTVAEWARHIGVPVQRIRNRIFRGHQDTAVVLGFRSIQRKRRAS